MSMEDDFEKFRAAYAAVTEILMAIRRGLDRLTDRSITREDGSFQRWKACHLEIEALRISFRRMRGNLYKQKDIYRTSAFAAEFLDEIETFKRSDNFRTIAHYETYFMSTVRPNDLLNNIYLREINLKGMSVSDAVDLASAIAKEVFIGGQTTMRGLTPIANLRSIVPAQSIAPVQFIVANGKIRVKSVHSICAEEDAKNIDIAKKELLAKGASLIDDLTKSNADRRLIESFRELQTSMMESKNIVAVGLANVTCELIGAQCSHELSDPLVIKIQAHARSVEMYAAQFLDWRRFVENASTIQINGEAVDQLHSATEILVSRLTANGETVDPEVPKTLKLIFDLHKKPGNTSKRILFALIKSVENLFSAIFSFSAEVLQETAEKTKQKTVKYASTLIVTAFIGIATSFIAPISNPIKEVSWIRTAIDLVQSQLKKSSE